jgi:hypothetical protein
LRVTGLLGQVGLFDQVKDPERLADVSIGPRFFEVLGARLATGRFFTREEMAPNGPRVVQTNGPVKVAGP